MGSLKTTMMAASAALLASAGAAAAADMMMAPPVIEAPEVAPAPVEIGSGWYLRGDVGWDREKPSMAYGADHDIEFAHTKASDSFLAGTGFGFKFNKFVRADVTVDWRRKDFEGTACFGGCGTLQYTSEKAEGDIWTGLVNLYFDLGHWHGVTPYVGGGLGVAYVDMGLHETWYPAGFAPPYTAIPGAASWNFAAALMAGLAFEVTDGVKLDVGYRYLWLDKARSDFDPFGNWIEYRDLAAQEIRVGFRYMID